MPRFSPEVEAILRQAGWHPGREVAESQWEQWLIINWHTKTGFHFQTRMFPAAFRILREFGGLVIEQNGSGVTWKRETFVIDPLKASQQTQAYNWPFIEWEADGSLYPIGYFGWDEVLAVDGQGRIIDVDNYLLYGESIEEALERIIIGLKPEKWEVDLKKSHEAANIFPMMRKQLGLE